MLFDQVIFEQKGLFLGSDDNCFDLIDMGDKKGIITLPSPPGTKYCLIRCLRFFAFPTYKTVPPLFFIR